MCRRPRFGWQPGAKGPVPLSKEVIASLLRSQWWDLPDALIVERVGELRNSAVSEFVANYDPSAGMVTDG